MIFLANIVVIVAMIVLGFALKSVHEHWGFVAYMSFCGGWLCATILWQCAHRSRYGVWFEPPVIDMTNGAEAGVDMAAKNRPRGLVMSGTGLLPPRATKS